jgi:hypothetical protein
VDKIDFGFVSVEFKIRQKAAIPKKKEAPKESKETATS